MTPSSTGRWRALAELLRPERARWLLLAAIVAVGSGLSLAGPVIVRSIVDRAGGGATAGHLMVLAGAFLVTALLAQVVAVVVSWFATTSAWQTTNGLRVRMARHVLGLDHEFHRRHTAGELIQRVDGDVTAVSDFLGRVVPRLGGAVVLVVGMLGVLAVLDLRLAAGMLVYVAVAATVVVRTRHRAVRESSDELGTHARLYGGIEERLAAGEDLRTNGALAHAMHRFTEDSARALRAGVRREHAFLTMWWAVQGSVIAGTVLALAVGGVGVASGALTVGTAFLLFQYVLLVGRPLEEIVHELETVQKASGAMIRVIDLLAEQPTVLDTGTTSPAPGPLSVEFRRVGFHYGDGETVLDDVDLDIPAGATIGVVGRTGSGKTTASRLVLRLVEATEGEVRLGGVPIAAIPQVELRRRVASIPQEVELFGGSIRDNVTLFDPAPDDAAVSDALRRVGLDRLADGDLHLPLGPGGAGVSAGEAQLLALARVWLRDPDLVVLDEATARVDPVTEARLGVAVAELVRGRTTIVIAHRLSTLRSMDLIAVFDEGRVVEFGAHAALADRVTSRFRHLLDLANERDDAGDAGVVEAHAVGAGGAS